MYLPRHFDESRPEVLHGLLRAFPLGLLITQGDDGAPVADAIPFLLEPARGAQGTLVAHVARANPLWRGASARPGAAPVLVVFQGPEGYISPAAYPAKAEHGKVVPTWNYAIVQARGPLQVMDDATLAHALVSRLTDRHEAARSHPWAVGDAPDDYIASMLRAIVGIEIPLQSLQGKYKLSQNRPEADRAGVVATLQAEAAPGAQALAQWVAVPGGAAP